MALETAHAGFAAAASAGRAVSPAAEWLLDNIHIVREQLRQIRFDLSRGYYRQLPKLIAGDCAGYPRVYAIALEMIAHTDSHLAVLLVTRFLRAYQSATTRESGVLWAVPIMRRFGLVENLRRVMDQSLVAHRTREAAEQCAERLAPSGVGGPDPIDTIAAALERSQAVDAFTVEILHRLRDLGPQIAPAFDW